MKRRNKKARELAERLGPRCWICGYVVPQLETREEDLHNNSLAASVDHVVPVSLGGSRDPENLRLSHRCCNVRRANREVTPGIEAWCRRTVERLWREKFEEDPTQENW